MSSSQTTHVICVGALYQDTIFTVPHFPHEDTKLRAESITKRRGGNTGNTLQVLSDLLSNCNSPPPTNLYLISSLPDPTSPDTLSIQSSLPSVSLLGPFRSTHTTAPSSFIIKSKQTGSRTIISHSNALPEMTFQEFKDALPNTSQPSNKTVVHFEGRNPDVVLECVRYLRDEMHNVLISIECEKPERTLMAEVARYADIVFYSKDWAEYHSHRNTGPKAFLQRQLSHTEYRQPDVTLVCTWGSSGAAGVRVEDGEAVEWAVREAWRAEGGVVVDTVGAGDTFIAGFLFGVVRGRGGLEERLGFAVEVAGRKVFGDGFGGLGEAMRERMGS